MRGSFLRSDLAGRAGALPATQTIFDVIGDLLADGRQVKQLVLDDRIVGLLGTLPVRPGILVDRKSVV